MSVYIGVAGGEIDFGICRDSIERLHRATEDDRTFYARATKGYEARQRHIDNFIESNHEWLLLLDHDMTFPQDTLTRLLSHEKTFVSGYYMFRQVSPSMRPIWFQPPRGELWPLPPVLVDPERGRLHELGASGWGCILLHRTAIEDTRKVLRGEPDVLEDVMDFRPYSFDVVVAALNSGDLDTLRSELRPLRGTYTGGGRMVGSDVRYAWFAREAGHILYGDPDVRCGHVTLYAVHPDDYSESFKLLGAEETQRMEAELEQHLGELHADYKEVMAAYV
jgi:hypothetical protein